MKNGGGKEKWTARVAGAACLSVLILFDGCRALAYGGDPGVNSSVKFFDTGAELHAVTQTSVVLKSQ